MWKPLFVDRATPPWMTCFNFFRVRLGPISNAHHALRLELKWANQARMLKYQGLP